MNAAPAPYPSYSVVGDRYTFLITGAETGGAYAVFDCFVPPGSGSPPHLHQREDEAFFVVEGEFEFTVAGERVGVSTGGFMFGRRGVPHNFKNIGSAPGRMIVTVTQVSRDFLLRSARESRAVTTHRFQPRPRTSRSCSKPLHSMGSSCSQSTETDNQVFLNA
jgi:mannose-6-phosphate isomerase-like protein (cupin superfamily)